MQNKRSLLLIPALVLIFALLGMLAEYVIFADSGAGYQARRAERILHKKEASLARLAERYEELALQKKDATGTQKLIAELQKEEMILLDYQRDSLVFWSDQTLNVPRAPRPWFMRKSFRRFPNGWYYVKPIPAENHFMLGLIKVKHQYSYENDLIRNTFVKDFRLPERTDIRLGEEAKYQVHSADGTPVFGLDFPEEGSCFTRCLNFPIALYFLSFIFLLLFISRLSRFLRDRWGWAVSMGVCLLLTGSTYLLLTYLKVPEVLWRMDLFSPYHFALSNLMPALGSYFTLSFLVLLAAYVFYRDARLEKLFRGDELKMLPWSLFWHVLAMAVFIGVFHLFRELIIHSNLSFEAHDILDITLMSILGFAATALLFFAWLFVYYRILYDSLQAGLKRFVPAGIVIAALLVVSLILWEELSLTTLISYVLLTLIIYAVYRRGRSLFHFGISFLFSLVFAWAAIHSIHTLQLEREEEKLKILAVNTDSRQDPVAEYMIVELSEALGRDSVLQTVMQRSFFTMDDVMDINGYLDEAYFDGFWQNYDFQITICTGDSDLELLDEGHHVGCFSYFNNLQEEAVQQVESSSFYYMDSELGRIRFFGALYFDSENGMKNGLFIDLYSKVAYTPSGYPELLTDKRYVQSSELSEYSYALYEHNELVVEAGEFAYSTKGEVFEPEKRGYAFLDFEGYRHLVYAYSSTEKIVISEPRERFIQTTVSFAYLVVFLLLIFLLLQLFIRVPAGNLNWRWNFENRLQFLFSSIIFFAFIGVGIGAVILSRQQYENRNYENISEKMRSVYVELEHKLSEETELSAQWYSESYGTLDDLLRKFSNVFYTDINLYAPNGFLLATSRPEVFERGLTGRHMSYTALIELRDRARGEFIQREETGKLNYLSAYVPFRNAENQVLAYLNLPYFSRQQSLTKDISNLVVTIVNFSFLLVLLTMALTVLLANRLTNPLRMIQAKLGSFRLGMKDAHIQYQRKDEIGRLVEEYNRMVDELTASAGKLARSERELAWREMAKQIAHEIKNPLTPMRLNVQQLERSWEGSDAEWAEKLKRFTRNMIEQIDNLSAIATAFSSFARMPQPRPEKLNLVTKLHTAADLFSNIRNIRLEVDCFGHRHVYIYADKEHLSIVFSNLIKNAIQAIPGGEEGLIRIELKVDMDAQKALVRIRDNGTGIPEEVRDKLFLPNFTTKSAGMGLGLAITKRIVEGASGTIQFETETGKGTSFLLEFPLYENKDSVRAD